jgi:prepilin-type N-terminal cleavage/methylation domain-containing protein
MLHVRKGTSLVELLVSIAILGVIMVPISTVLYQGFRSYYVESDIMISTQKAREVMDKIIEDIRMNDSPDINIEDSGRTLNIVKDNPLKEDLVYKLTTIAGNSVLLRNSELVFKPEDNIILLEFNAKNERPMDYDSQIIKITLGIKVGKSDPVTLESSYRRKTG